SVASQDQKPLPQRGNQHTNKNISDMLNSRQQRPRRQTDRTTRWQHTFHPAALDNAPCIHNGFYFVDEVAATVGMGFSLAVASPWPPNNPKVAWAGDTETLLDFHDQPVSLAIPGGPMSLTCTPYGIRTIEF
ncbi:unnamed protein product, partial [Ectocarpus fasciculatus]